MSASPALAARPSQPFGGRRVPARLARVGFDRLENQRGEIGGERRRRQLPQLLGEQAVFFPFRLRFRMRGQVNLQLCLLFRGQRALPTGFQELLVKRVIHSITFLFYNRQTGKVAFNVADRARRRSANTV